MINVLFSLVNFLNCCDVLCFLRRLKRYKIVACASFLIIQTFVLSQSRFWSLFDRSKPFSMSLDQVEVPYQKTMCQTFQDQTCLCPDHPGRNLPVTFEHSKIFLRSSCVQKSLCPDFHVFKIKWPDFCGFQFKIRANRFWKFLRSCPDYLAFINNNGQTFVRSKVRISILSCVYVLTYRQFDSYNFYTAFL